MENFFKLLIANIFMSLYIYIYIVYLRRNLVWLSAHYQT